MVRSVRSGGRLHHVVEERYPFIILTSILCPFDHGFLSLYDIPLSHFQVLASIFSYTKRNNTHVGDTLVRHDLASS